jgi:DNA (cytosine-5)-methyltransferase 1
MRSPTVISTFAGCGGSSLGYKMAGCKVLAAVEWEAHAVECYRANHEGTQVFHEDIAKVQGSQLLEALQLEPGDLDILDGSPPCQGFSTSGRRVLEDPRNSLFREHLRLVDELEPKCVVIENVAGMVKGKMKAVAGEIVSSLKARGYAVAAGVMDAQYFGVPQRRVRTVFLGSRVGQPRLPRPTSRPVPCGVALRGVEPDEMLWPRGPIERLLCKHMQPGENGSHVMARIGRKKNNGGSAMLHPAEVAPTLTKQTRSRVTLLHWDRRQISIREALVLGGFPPDFILPGTFQKRWARIGNSVAPPMAREIARQSLIPLLKAAGALD